VFMLYLLLSPCTPITGRVYASAECLGFVCYGPFAIAALWSAGGDICGVYGIYSVDI
jgi:hypothetical protein